MNNALSLSDLETKSLERHIELWLKENHPLAPNQCIKISTSIKEVKTVTLSNGSTLSLDELLASPLSTLQIVPSRYSSRIQWMLGETRFTIIGEAVRCREHTYRKYRNVGNKTIEEFRDQLSTLGLSLEMKAPIGPLERAIYDKYLIERLSYSYCPSEVVDLLKAQRITSFGDLRKLSERRKFQLTSDLGAIPKVQTQSYSSLNLWLDRYPTGEQRLSDIMHSVTDEISF